MKASMLREWLFSQSEILKIVCGGESGSGLRRISEVLVVRENATVTEVCRVLEKVERYGGDGGNKVGPIADLLSLMVESACKFAKASDANDLKRFAGMLASKKEESIDAFISRGIAALQQKAKPAASAGLSEGDMRAYLKQLEEALGDDSGFEAVYKRLSADTRLKAPQAKQLAKAFVGKSGRGKADALGLIYRRHESLMSARSKADATGSRLAG